MNRFKIKSSETICGDVALDCCKPPTRIPQLEVHYCSSPASIRTLCTIRVPVSRSIGCVTFGGQARAAPDQVCRTSDRVVQHLYSFLEGYK